MSVKIDLKIFLFAIIFYFTKQIKIYALLMILALVHELGHLVCGICLGLKLKSIKITPVGFQILFKKQFNNYSLLYGKSQGFVCVFRELRVFYMDFFKKHLTNPTQCDIILIPT